MDMSGMNVATHDSDGVSRLGIEWYDHMGAMNRLSTRKNMFWFLRDVKTGKVNHEIDWKFQRGSQVLIRIRNDSSTTSPVPNRMMHPMPHPIHFHGNRFLVLRENGVANRDLLVWKDTHLVGMGFTVDILLDASNPGPWMFHCHWLWSAGEA
jgi:FtsP/CotA-like multicopper oxidase with cupredoxin domain